MSQKVVSYYEDFNEIEKKIWDLLTKAVTDRSSEFRTPVFICGNDEDLDGRVVVLRKADQEKSFVQYHSDIRSSKIDKIKKNPNCSILFYGKQEKIPPYPKTLDPMRSYSKFLAFWMNYKQIAVVEYLDGFENVLDKPELPKETSSPLINF